MRIVLADDHRMVRKGLRALLEGTQGFEVVGEAEDGRSAEQVVEAVHPDVVIMDQKMPGLNGVIATRHIRERFPTVRVVALSMHSDQDSVLEMVRAGASAYLLKTCDIEELIQAIHAAVEGRVYLSPDIAAAVVDGCVNGWAGAQDTADSLSLREQEVLQMLAEGHNAKQIGLTLHVSSRTVDSHRQRIMEKLHIHTLAGLVKYAVRKGLTSIEA